MVKFKNIKTPKLGSKKLFILCISLIWTSFLVYQGCDSTDPPIVLESKNSFLETSTYVGEKECKSCHAEEYDKWQNSHHALAMMHANDSTVFGDFGDVTYKSKGSESRFYKKDESFIINTIGPSGSSEDFEVKYTFGTTPLQQYLVELPGGRLQALHLAWDTDKNQWFDLYPNDTFPAWDWMHWTNGAMTWNKMCADCHSTNLQKNYNSEKDEYTTTWSLINVSCEECHGPGQAHVELVNSSNYREGTDPFSYMIQTASTPPIVQIEQCAPCHSRRSQLGTDYDHTGRFMDHYTPDLLHTNLYFADGQILEEDYVYGSYVQSKMFQNGVKCSNCHDPHSAELKQTGNQLCITCHSNSKYNTPEHHFHKMDNEGASCIECHMPGRYYMVNDFRRDHSFRVPRPDLSAAYNTPNACNQCHTDESPSWAAKAIVEWYGPERKPHFSDILVRRNDPEALDELINLVKTISEPGIVRATAISSLVNFPSEHAYQTILLSLKDREAIVRVAALQALFYLPKEDRIRFVSVMLEDPIRSVRITAANVLADVDSSEIRFRYKRSYAEASIELKNMLLGNEDFSSGQLQIAQYYDRRGEIEKAIKAYRKTIRKDSLMPGVRTNLARLYSRNGRNDAAIQVLKDAIALDHQDDAAMFSLGLVAAEENDSDLAIKSFRDALNIQPDNMRIYYNLGLVYQNQNKLEKAISTFLDGLMLNQNADDIRYALVTAYAADNNYKAALQEAKILGEKFPQNQDILNLISQLDSQIK